MSFLPSCVPNFHFSHRVFVNTDKYWFSISTMSLYFFYFEQSMWIYILELETRFANVMVSQNGDLNSRRCILFFFTPTDDLVPNFRCRDVWGWRNSLETMDSWWTITILGFLLLRCCFHTRGRWISIIVDYCSWAFNLLLHVLLAPCSCVFFGLFEVIGVQEANFYLLALPSGCL